jgi:hypothetical protein
MPWEAKGSVNKLRVQWANSGEEAMEVFPAVYVT